MAQDFRVDLRAVVELLARHVYSSPHVFVRELLQNGVDAITARRRLDPAAPGGPIELRPSDGGGDTALLVDDPGIGLTAEEMRTLLATIGGSSKRDVLDLPSEDFLGRFGIGLLSCFVIADTIEVSSRSASGAAPVRFVGHADGTFEIHELSDQDARPTVGTTVRLAPRADARSWVRSDEVERLARHYGSVLPVPVVVHRADGRTVDVTDADQPWLNAATGANAGRRIAQAAWCEQEFGFTPLAAVVIRSESTGAEGVAFVLPSESHPTIGRGHRAYLRRMLLGDEVPALLPEWAFFVRAVLDVGELTPTASREALVDDDALALARSELGEGLRSWLVRLGSTRPDELERVLRVHGRAAKGLAVHDDEVFSALAPWFAFETSDGPMTLGELARRSPLVRFTPTVERFRQLAPIASAQGLVIVNAGYTFDRELIERVALVAPGAIAEVVEDTEIVATLDAVDPLRDAVAQRFLEVAERALAESDCDVDLRAFDPEVLPALLLFDEEAQQRRRQRRTADEVDELWSSLLADLDDGRGDRPLLVFNDRHALVRRLVEAAGAPATTAAVRALYVQALLLSHQPLRGTDVASLNAALLELVDQAISRPDGPAGWSS
jgi:molecular chaperone HtpG